MIARTAAVFLVAAAPLAIAQVIPTRDNNPELQRMAGCALAGKTYTCNKADLHRALALSQTIRIDTAPPNQASLAALTSLVHSLGKTVATPDQQADLLMTLQPTDSVGVDVGPNSGRPLAVLRVLIADHSGGPDKLLWVETYTGDASRPWPLIARAAAAQLQQSARSR